MKIKPKRLVSLLLACMAVFSFAAIPAQAAEAPDNNTVILRATGRLNHTIPKNSVLPIGAEFSLEAGDKVTFNCSYTPKSASVDFGYIDSDNTFHFLNSTSGSIYKALEIPKSGQYTIAIRNNASYAITVTGTIKY